MMKSQLLLLLFFCCGMIQGQPRMPDSSTFQRSTLNYHCKFDNSAYFQEGDATTILNFEAKILEDALDKYPTLIIEFSLCQLPGESKELGEQRFQVFRELLEKEKFDFKRIQFSPEIHYYTDDQLTKTELKPGIFGIVKSI